MARRSPWCRGTPAHVHWSLLRSSNLRDSPRARASRYFILSPQLFAPPSHPPHFRQLPSYRQWGVRYPATRDLPPPPQLLSLNRLHAGQTLVPPPNHFATPSHHFCNPHPEWTTERQSTVIVSPHRPTSHAVTILSLRFTCDLSAFINHIATKLFCASALLGELWRTLDGRMFYFMGEDFTGHQCKFESGIVSNYFIDCNWFLGIKILLRNVILKEELNKRNF